MSMTKKDYELIARILKYQAEQVMSQDIKRRGTRGKANMQDLVVMFSDELEQRSQRFDRYRFNVAAGLFDTLAND